MKVTASVDPDHASGESQSKPRTVPAPAINGCGYPRLFNSPKHGSGDRPYPWVLTQAHGPFRWVRSEGV